MEDLSLHVLDIAENSITAGATRIEITVIEDRAENLLVIEVSDNGPGMEEKMLRHAEDPFFTTRTTRRVGLGIPMLAQAAKASMGDIAIESSAESGTAIRATFQYDHIDRQPLGDMAETITILITSNPEKDFLYEHRRGAERYHLDTVEMRKLLEGLPLNSPEAIRIIREDMHSWLNRTDNMIK